MHIVQSTASGEQHGLINVLANSVPDDGYKNLKGEAKKRLESEKQEDGRIVKAEYMNRRGNHERLTKPYCKYAGDPIQIWHFIPGYTYEVPYGLIKEVNDKNKVMKKRQGLLSLDGKSVKQDETPLEKDQEGEWLHKFIPVGFKS